MSDALKDWAESRERALHRGFDAGNSSAAYVVDGNLDAAIEADEDEHVESVVLPKLEDIIRMQGSPEAKEMQAVLRAESKKLETAEQIWARHVAHLHAEDG